jgi:hypothetical protein
MKKIGFGKLLRGIASAPEAPGVQWVSAPYPRLVGFNAAVLDGKSGLYAIWHLGVRPQWLRAGFAMNLGAAVRQLVDMPWVKMHEGNTGIFLAWAFVTPVQGMGLARDLVEKLKPAFQAEPFLADATLDEGVARASCPLPPGTSE